MAFKHNPERKDRHGDLCEHEADRNTEETPVEGKVALSEKIGSVGLSKKVEIYDQRNGFPRMPNTR